MSARVKRTRIVPHCWGSTPAYCEYEQHSCHVMTPEPERLAVNVVGTGPRTYLWIGRYPSVKAADERCLGAIDGPALLALGRAIVHAFETPRRRAAKQKGRAA